MRVEYSPASGLYLAFALNELDVAEATLIALIERYREEGNDTTAAEAILEALRGHHLIN